MKYAQVSAVGISNMLVDVGVLNFLLLLGPTRGPELLVLYNVAALVLANANSYLWNTLWTFRDQTRHDAKQVGELNERILEEFCHNGPNARRSDLEPRPEASSTRCE